MPAPVERPDDVLHRTDRRDDDAHLLRKPGPPHLRRPRDPHPQTARRRRRNEVAFNAETLRRRDKRREDISKSIPKTRARADPARSVNGFCFSLRLSLRLSVSALKNLPASPSTLPSVPENPTETRRLPPRRAALSGWPAGSPTSRRTAASARIPAPGKWRAGGPPWQESA